MGRTSFAVNRRTCPLADFGQEFSMATATCVSDSSKAVVSTVFAALETAPARSALREFVIPLFTLRRQDRTVGVRFR